MLQHRMPSLKTFKAPLQDNYEEQDCASSGNEILKSEDKTLIKVRYQRRKSMTSPVEQHRSNSNHFFYYYIEQCILSNAGDYSRHHPFYSVTNPEMMMIFYFVSILQRSVAASSSSFSKPLMRLYYLYLDFHYSYYITENYLLSKEIKEIISIIYNFVFMIFYINIFIMKDL
jgi:hypothetical protein